MLVKVSGPWKQPFLTLPSSPLTVSPDHGPGPHLSSARSHQPLPCVLCHVVAVLCPTLPPVVLTYS